MARPYTLDLRERVVAQVARGMSCRDVAALNDIAPSTVVKWSGRKRTTGSPAAKPMGGKRPYLLEEHRDWLIARLEEKPDLTLYALLDELATRGIVVACDTLWRFLKREGGQLQKKCSRPSRIGLTSRGGVHGGGGCRDRSRRSGSSSSTRPGRKPT